MTAAPRERLVVDLRGQGQVLKAHASSRGLTVSEVARQALAAYMAAAGPAPASLRESTNEPGQRTVKQSIRMPGQVAMLLAAASQASGCSQGIYIERLLDGRPAPPIAIAGVLGRSTDQLATTLADLNEVMRILDRGSDSSNAALEGWLKPLAADLRAHLDVAARLLAEIRSPHSLVRARSTSLKPDGANE